MLTKSEKSALRKAVDKVVLKTQKESVTDVSREAVRIATLQRSKFFSNESEAIQYTKQYYQRSYDIF